MAEREDRTIKMMNDGTSKTGIDALQGLIIDMDGVLWHGEQPLPGLSEFFKVLRRRGIRLILATNNNTQTPEGFARKATSLGAEIAPDEVLTATIATIHYLKQKYPAGTQLYVIGEPPLKKLLQEAGYILGEQGSAAVVVAMDRQLTYDMLKRGTLLIRAGAEFIGTNPDPSYPTPEGIVPGSGAILAALRASTDCDPVVIGKPERLIFDIALDRLSLPVDKVASLGDRLDTDIAGGQRAGLKSILVLSGITRSEDLKSSPIQPTWVFSGIDSLARALDIGS